jgi:hypothetical protein
VLKGDAGSAQEMSQVRDARALPDVAGVETRGEDQGLVNFWVSRGASGIGATPFHRRRFDKPWQLVVVHGWRRGKGSGGSYAGTAKSVVLGTAKCNLLSSSAAKRYKPHDLTPHVYDWPARGARGYRSRELHQHSHCLMIEESRARAGARTEVQ